VYSFYVFADTDVSDIQVCIISVVVAYSVQCFKNSADCHMYTLNAVRDGIKLSTVESYMC